MGFAGSERGVWSRRGCVGGGSGMLLLLWVWAGCLPSSGSCFGVRWSAGSPAPSRGAEFDRLYTGYVSREVEEIYAFNYTSWPRQAGAIRVFVNTSSDDLQFPVLFVVRQQKSILSWQIPLILRGLYQRVYTYQEVSRILCPVKPLNEKEPQPHYMFVDVASLAPFKIHYELLVSRVHHFSIETSEMFTFTATPSEPRYFMYEFPQDIDSVIIKVVSEKAYPCCVVSVQDIVCPVYDLDHNVEFTGVYQTMTKISAITVQKKDFPDGKFYTVLVIKPEDYACGGSIPFYLIGGKENYTENQDRIKQLQVTIVPSISETVYIQVILVCFFTFFSFYVGALLVAFVHYIRFHQTNLIGTDEGNGTMSATHPITFGAPEGGSYGAIEESSPDVASQISSPLDVDHCSEQGENNFDTEQDIEFDKEMFRSKTFLFVSDLSRKDNETVSRKYKIYFWNITTIAVFYALPVIQLVITYQTVVNVTGNQDICYYNFLCIHPLGVLSAFNNILSNIGYVMLGFLFFLIVLRKDILYKRALETNDIYALEYGIPKHFGLFYAMAVALMMEGVLSACYHVCPNYSNFQFDTSFMYMIAGLCMLKLYQTRHPDINANAYSTYAIFAVIICFAVLGVIFGKNATWFWILFSIIHVMASLGLSTQIYYMGRFKIDVSNADFGIFRRIGIVLYTDCIQQFSRPIYMDRMVLLVLGNLVNWSFAIFGIVSRPKDFASYLLCIFICNLLLYLAFYIIMKLRSSESIRTIPLFCIFATTFIWAFALYFFFQTLTSWEQTPAESREQNSECILLNFFDEHDVWHFLSATAVFFSFLVLLTLDDDLDFVRRDKIPVF